MKILALGASLIAKTTCIALRLSAIELKHLPMHSLARHILDSDAKGAFPRFFWRPYRLSIIKGRETKLGQGRFRFPIIAILFLSITAIFWLESFFSKDLAMFASALGFTLIVSVMAAMAYGSKYHDLIAQEYGEGIFEDEQSNKDPIQNANWLLLLFVVLLIMTFIV